MRGWLAIAATAGVTAVTAGCSLLVGLNGLAGGGGCEGACGDASVTPAGDATVTDTADASTFETEDAALANDATTVGTDDARAIDSGGEDARVTAPLDASPTPDAAVCTPASSPTLDDCTALAAIATAPVIDGVLDCGVQVWSMPVVLSVGPGPIPTTVKATVATAWRPNGLYFFVRVSGAGSVRYPSPASTGIWCGDAIELFVDSNGTYTDPPLFDDPGTIQVIVSAPTSNGGAAPLAEMFRNTDEIGAWTGNFTAIATSDGFALEAFIVASDLGLSSWSLVDAAHVGLDVAVDLGSPTQPASCPRLAQFTIQVPDPSTATCVAACDVGDFCNPVLQ